MSTAPGVLASRGVGHDEGISIDQDVIPQDRERKGTSQRHGRMSAEALSKARQARKKLKPVTRAATWQRMYMEASLQFELRRSSGV